MLKIAIVGCGRIADQHATEIQKLPGCRLIAVCDREELMASQMSERFNTPYYFSDIGQLLDISPDVVHITTPPQSHFSLGKLCLDAGCHVFIEKPFTLNAADAQVLIDLAQQLNLKLTVGHNAQFSHSAMRMRKLVESGYLGGNPVHMDSTWCYPFTDPGYAKAILGDDDHWVRSLPGRYLHDIICHGIARIVEFWKTDDPLVLAHGFVGPLLSGIDETDIIDELRVVISDKQSQTAYFTFSSQMAPPIKQFRLYGPKNSLIIDHEHQTVVRISPNLKSYLNHLISPLYEAREYLLNTKTNILKFLKADLYYESGRKYLIESFYRSIDLDSPLPISYRQILLTTQIMESIFQQIYDQ